MFLSHLLLCSVSEENRFCHGSDPISPSFSVFCHLHSQAAKIFSTKFCTAKFFPKAWITRHRTLGPVWLPSFSSFHQFADISVLRRHFETKCKYDCESTASQFLHFHTRVIRRHQILEKMSKVEKVSRWWWVGLVIRIMVLNY